MTVFVSLVGGFNRTLKESEMELFINLIVWSFVFVCHLIFVNIDQKWSLASVHCSNDFGNLIPKW